MAGDLTGIAAAVDPEQVQAQLINRRTTILDEDSSQNDLYLELVRGIAAEVVPYSGSDPEDGPRRDLALWCITLGVAARLEYALYPEQQAPGNDGRGYDLQRQYERLLKQLASIPLPAGEAGATPPNGPRATFPAAQAYPDPTVGTRMPRWPWPYGGVDQ